MRATPDVPAPRQSHTETRRALARRVADAHGGIDNASLLALVSEGVDDNTDVGSDVDMSVVLRELPKTAVLEAARQRCGGTRWNRTIGSLEDGLVVSFRLEGYRLMLMLCGLNGRYFTRFQVKRVSRLAEARAWSAA